MTQAEEQEQVPAARAPVMEDSFEIEEDDEEEEEEPLQPTKAPSKGTTVAQPSAAPSAKSGRASRSRGKENVFA